MRVLVVNKYYAPDIGGVETMVRQFAEWLARAHRVTVLVCEKRFAVRTTARVENGVRVVRCSSLGSFLSMPASVSFLTRFIGWRRNYDVVHFHEPFPLASLVAVLPKPASCRYVVTWHSDIVRQRLLAMPVRLLQRRLLRSADAITTTNGRQVRGSRVLRRFSDRTTVIPASIDAKACLAPSEAVNWTPPLPRDFILFLGRLSYYKGIFVLLRAMEKVRSSTPLVIAGDGPLAGEIRREVRKGKSNVVLIDREVSEEEKRDLFRRCRFYVFPSIYVSEAFGITQLEAMVHGKPVINSNLPTGVPWVSLDGVSGITVPPGDADALSGAIDALCQSIDTVERLGRNARQRVLDLFDERVALPKIDEVYGRLEFGGPAAVGGNEAEPGARSTPGRDVAGSHSRDSGPRDARTWRHSVS